MRNVKYKNWEDFRRGFLSDYVEQGRERRGQLIFRGHQDSGWLLKTTLDREKQFANDDDRDRYFERLLLEFRREATALIPDPTSLPDGVAFELLARHHSVPSPILDWSESPYIASFFAFENADSAPKKRIAVWVFDRATFSPAGSGIQLIDELDLIRFNRRALRQRGLFTRVLTIRQPVEEMLTDSLTKITIPASSQAEALSDLDEMGINAAMLFSDLDGAARTARYRLSS